MLIKEKFSSSLGRKDQEPNKQLAAEIVDSGGKKEILQIVSPFNESAGKEIKKDCILC